MKKTITLFCAMGMSTSLVVAKMKEEAKNYSDEYEIEAYPYSEYTKYADQADVIFLGPQVRFYLNEIKSKYPNKIIEVIDLKMYGKCDGAALFKRAQELMNDSK